MGNASNRKRKTSSASKYFICIIFKITNYLIILYIFHDACVHKIIFSRLIINIFLFMYLSNIKQIFIAVKKKKIIYHHSHRHGCTINYNAKLQIQICDYKYFYQS